MRQIVAPLSGLQLNEDIQSVKMASWYTNEAELELIEMWRSEPLLFSDTSKGQVQRQRRHAATARLAEHFGTSSKWCILMF